jgi:hypothetical protein
MTMPAKTMFDKIWERHAILEEDDELWRICRAERRDLSRRPGEGLTL